MECCMDHWKGRRGEAHIYLRVRADDGRTKWLLAAQKQLKSKGSRKHYCSSEYKWIRLAYGISITLIINRFIWARVNLSCFDQNDESPLNEADPCCVQPQRSASAQTAALRVDGRKVEQVLSQSQGDLRHYLAAEMRLVTLRMQSCNRLSAEQNWTNRSSLCWPNK